MRSDEHHPFGIDPLSSLGLERVSDSSISFRYTGRGIKIHGIEKMSTGEWNVRLELGRTTKTIGGYSSMSEAKEQTARYLSRNDILETEL